MQYSTGSVTVTNGSNIVTGSGTSWLGIVLAGAAFKIQGENAIYQVATDCTSNIDLEIIPVYAGVGGSGKSYQIVVDFTPNYNLAEVWAGDRDWPYHLTVNTIRKLDTIIKGLEDRIAALE